MKSGSRGWGWGRGPRGGHVPSPTVVSRSTTSWGHCRGLWHRHHPSPAAPHRHKRQCSRSPALPPPVFEGTFARRARHPNQGSGHPSQCLTPKHHSSAGSLTAAVSGAHVWAEWLHYPCLLGGSPTRGPKNGERGGQLGKRGETLPRALTHSLSGRPRSPQRHKATRSKGAKAQPHVHLCKS